MGKKVAGKQRVLEKSTNVNERSEKSNIEVFSIGGSVIVHQYRFFYFLANELAYKALKDKHEINAHRYAVGAVIMSYTTIETYFNHIFFSREYPLQNLHNNMSDELLKKIERMSLPEKIEFALRFHPTVNSELLNRNKEPYQSFDLVRRMRNFLIHYVPEEEFFLTENQGEQYKVSNLERKLFRKFPFLSPADIRPDDFTNDFLKRVFNRHCAKWSFERVAPFVDALSKAFEIESSYLETHWNLNDVSS